MNTKNLLAGLILSTLTLTPTHAKPLPRQMCFESVPVQSFFSVDNSFTYPSPEAARAHPYAYQTYQITLLHQLTDSNGYQLFQFIGHGSDRAGDHAAMQGVGYTHPATKSIHIEYTANLYQPLTPIESSSTSEAQPQPGPVYALHSIWTLNKNLNGTAVQFNDITNTNVLPNLSQAANANNDFNFANINRIPCSNVLQ